VDVVGLAVKPTCVTRLAVLALNRFLKPRSIRIVTPTREKCAVFEGMAANVRCLLDGEVVPGVSKGTVGDYISARYREDGQAQNAGRTTAGWYLQQFVKLGAARHVPGLSDHFVLWDMDMIALRPLALFEGPGRKKVRFNVGGKDARHYEHAYAALTGRPLEYAPDGTSFVTHWMTIYKPHMEELLRQFETERDDWPWRILDALEPKKVYMGFSEYASYASWVRQRHPEDMHVVPRRTWIRHPPGGALLDAFQMLARKDRLCCPSPAVLDALHRAGYEYAGYEVGHHALCGYQRPEHELSYGV